MDCDDDNFIERINRSIVTEVLIKIRISEFSISIFHLDRCKNLIFSIERVCFKIRMPRRNGISQKSNITRIEILDAVARNVVERTW